MPKESGKEYGSYLTKVVIQAMWSDVPSTILQNHYNVLTCACYYYYYY